MPRTHLPHILLKEKPAESIFTSPKGGGQNPKLPERDRKKHANFLLNRLKDAWLKAENEKKRAVSHSTRNGVYLEIKGEEGYELTTKSLENQRSKDKKKWIRLLNVRKVKHIHIDKITKEEEELYETIATIFVPVSQKKYFANKISKYATELTKTDKFMNKALVESISDIQNALLVESFWQDHRDLIPADKSEWCEVWLSNDSDEVIHRFDRCLKDLRIISKHGHIKFPERIVKLVYATRTQLENLTRNSDDIAEYRKAKVTAEFWTKMDKHEETQWVQNLLERLKVDRESLISICLLDTGVNCGHPLLSPLLAPVDCQSVVPLWETNDHKGHGTLMAGISAYGDLANALESNGPVIINHVLESVKILPPPKYGHNAPELWGYITSQAISQAEIQSPFRKRINCMSVTSDDAWDRGKPSSWSGALDQITSGVDDKGKRLIIVSAGNADIKSRKDYPDAQITDSIHDPGQSWNALTVGAYTQLNTISDPTFRGYTPIARPNQLSPFSTTSFTWEDIWPIKPEIVMEGGNAAADAGGFITECADLSMLSTHYDPQTKLLDYINQTSSAASLAANFAARIQSLYPDYWPETIRALMVHSAEWPDALKRQFVRDESKTELRKLLRICGYGVPNLERALYSASNSLTLIAQAEIQPFITKGSERKTKDMHFYTLPWPAELLLTMRDVQVQMRITLSYFVEPGPGEIGWKDRYRYASHALRFDINSPGESDKEFKKRINQAARDENEERSRTISASTHWVIGQKARDKGSIHSDIWNGTAEELAASRFVAVSPRIGWWRERKHLGKCDSRTRYALIVSISSPELEVDIYTPVAQQVGVEVPVTSWGKRERPKKTDLRF